MSGRRRQIPRHLRVQVLTRDGYRCKMCGRGSDHVILHVDHIKPVDEGGTDEIANLATLCEDCNIGKSSYRFTDYMNVRLVPDELPSHFQYFHDAKRGDYEEFHLYCYYQLGTEPGGRKDKFHRTWRITGTQWDTSSNQRALENRRRAEEALAFVRQIREEVASERKRLVLTEEGLCLI